MPSSPAHRLRPLAATLLGVAALLLWGWLGARWLARPGDHARPIAAHWLADPDARLDLAAVVASPPERFSHLGDTRVSLDVAEARVVWLRAEVFNDSPAPRTSVVELMSVVDRLDGYIRAGPDPAAWPRHVSGRAVSSSERTDGVGLIGLPVPLAPGERREVWLRLQDSSAQSLRLREWPDARLYHAADRLDFAVQAIYLGILLGLGACNLFAYLRVGERVMGAYLAFLATFGAAALVASDLLPLTSLWRVNLSQSLLTASALALVCFSRRFLDLRRHLPRLDVALLAVAVMLVLLLVAPFLPGLRQQATVVHAGFVLQWLLVVVLIPAAGLAAWRRGAPQAGWFVLAFGLMLACFAPAMIGSLLGYETGLSEAYLIRAGSVLEMTVLAFALAERFRVLREQALRTKADHASRLEDEVDARTRELASANRQKDRLFALIGHDLRGPVSAVMQTARQLGRRAESATPSEVAARGEEIEATGRGVLGLLDNLLDWARLQTGAAECRPCPVAPADILDSVRRLLDSVARASGVDLRIELSNTRSVLADPAMLETILRNLAANALAATPAGGAVVLRVEPAASAPEGITLSVTDTGRGLARERLAELGLDDAAADIPSESRRGLGLVVCREFLALHGSRLRAESEPGRGSRFHFTLPAA